MAYFPMFVDLENQPCLIVGGGKVALRKVQVLLDFGAVVTVLAPKVIDEIKAYSQVKLEEKSFQEEDLSKYKLVVAATDDHLMNHKVAKACMELKIPINAVDQVEDCSFIFPSYVRQEDLVAAFSSGGKSPVMTQYLKAQMKEVMTEELGALTECLGSLRDEVKEKVSTEALRKKVYQKILELGLRENTLPTREQIEEVIEEFSKES